jgi:hypothetical protein
VPGGAPRRANSIPAFAPRLSPTSCRRIPPNILLGARSGAPRRDLPARARVVGHLAEPTKCVAPGRRVFRPTGFWEPSSRARVGHPGATQSPEIDSAPRSLILPTLQGATRSGFRGPARAGWRRPSPTSWRARSATRTPPPISPRPRSAAVTADPYLAGSALHLSTLAQLRRRHRRARQDWQTRSIAAAREAGAEHLARAATRPTSATPRAGVTGVGSGRRLRDRGARRDLDARPEAHLPLLLRSGTRCRRRSCTASETPSAWRALTARVLFALDTMLRRYCWTEARTDPRLARSCRASGARPIPPGAPARLRRACPSRCERRFGVPIRCWRRLGPICRHRRRFGAVPFRLFDGAWTREKRDVLRRQALAALEMAMPGAGRACDRRRRDRAARHRGGARRDRRRSHGRRSWRPTRCSSAWPDVPYPRCPSQGPLSRGLVARDVRHLCCRCRCCENRHRRPCERNSSNERRCDHRGRQA